MASKNVLRSKVEKLAGIVAIFSTCLYVPVNILVYRLDFKLAAKFWTTTDQETWT